MVNGRNHWNTRLGAGLLMCLLATLLAGCGFTYGGEKPFVVALTPTAPAPVTVPKADVPNIGAHEAILLNATTHEVYWAKAADDPVPMASTTKIMTALVAIQYGKLDQPVRIGQDSVAMQNNINSVAGLKLDDSLTLRELLYALMLPSGDDAAVAVADAVAGSQPHFVALMNLEAALLGLHQTHYVNVHGLDAPGHQTTARDLARLAGYAMANPTFAQVVKTSVYTLPYNSAHRDYTWNTTNSLISPTGIPYDGALGVKTGHTDNAGYCLVFAASRPKGMLIGVMLDDGPDGGTRFYDARDLLNWGYDVTQ